MAVTDLCDEYHLQPTVFYLWQRQAFERLSDVLQDGRTARGPTQARATDLRPAHVAAGDHDRVRGELLANCKRDTWAIVKLLERLRGLAPA